MKISIPILLSSHFVLFRGNIFQIFLLFFFFLVFTSVSLNNLLVLLLDVLVLEIVTWIFTIEDEDLALFPSPGFFFHLLSLPSHLPAS